jgi:hypothetical protein
MQMVRGGHAGKAQKGMTDAVIGAFNLVKKRKKKKKKHGGQGCLTHNVGEVMGSGNYPALRCGALPGHHFQEF